MRTGTAGRAGPPAGRRLQSDVDDRQFLPRWYRILTWSFPLGRAFGIQVRLYWTAVFVFLLSLFTFLDWRIFSFGKALGLAAIWTAILYLIVWTHELGHAFAARRWNVPTSRITLSVFGGLCHLQDGMPSPKSDIVVSIAGPATHLLWLAVVWPLSILLGTPYGWEAGEITVDLATFTVWNLRTLNLGLLLFNLLPFFPMDFGRVLRALLSFRLHPNRATIWACRVGIAGAIGLGVWGLTLGGLSGGLLLALAINNGIACGREIQAARFSAGPFGEPREAWEADPDAWKSGGGMRAGGMEADLDDRPARKRGGLRLFSRGAPRAPDVLVSERPGDDEVLDRLLEKVGRVGLAGLSAAERADLQRISAAKRRNP